jgi:hypothetical protein
MARVEANRSDVAALKAAVQTLLRERAAGTTPAAFIRP